MKILLSALAYLNERYDKYLVNYDNNPKKLLLLRTKTIIAHDRILNSSHREI